MTVSQDEKEESKKCNLLLSAVLLQLGIKLFKNIMSFCFLTHVRKLLMQAITEVTEQMFCSHILFYK